MLAGLAQLGERQTEVNFRRCNLKVLVSITKSCKLPLLFDFAAADNTRTNQYK